MSHPDDLTHADWRKSSFSGSGGVGSGDCVEVAPLADGRIALRNSNHPEAGTAFFTRPQMHAWLTACKAGELHDLA